MDSKNRIALIAQSKSVHGRRGFYGRYALRDLRDDFVRSAGTCDLTKDVYPVRAISILEVFTRGWTSRLVDHSPEFAERALPALQNFKLDYSVLLSITGELITFGDIVGFAISVNRFEQIIATFSMLCGIDVVRSIRTVVDAWEERSLRGPAKPIITDYDRTIKAVATMFELRHVICHEAPHTRELDLSGLEYNLNAVWEFASALEEVLLQTMYGKNRPLTQSEMNVAAYEEYKRSEQRLDEILAALREQYKDHPQRLETLNAAQNAWNDYMSRQTDFRYNDRGTIGPTLRAGEMKSLTDERQKRLEQYVGNQYL